jgi:type IV pilus assembly protein PilY1
MDGRWVVIVTSGYNNVPPVAPNGDGHGYLYVLDAFTGAIISKTDTGVGDTTTPSGLAQISSFVSDSNHDNTTLRVYGGDLLGNVWRFNINATTPSATLLGTAKDTSGVAQPISVAPELGLRNGRPIVLVGTGLLLGPSDLTNTQMQSVYGIVDPLTDPATAGTPIYSDLRTSLAHDGMTVDSLGKRTTYCDNNCTSIFGWVLDLPHTGTAVGERVNVNMQLVFGTLAFITNQPNNSACSSGGYSYVNYVNYANGLPVKVATQDVNGNIVINTQTGYLNSNSIVTGHAIITLGTGGPSGSGTGSAGSGSGIVGGTNTLTTDNTGTMRIGGVPIVPPAPDGKRVSWHEIVQ